MSRSKMMLQHRLHGFVSAVLVATASAAAAEQHAAHPPGVDRQLPAHPKPRLELRRADLDAWRGGHWWRGRHGWWVVGPVLYWYPAVVAAVPDPLTPTGLPPGWWYWCADYQQYYPLVADCPSDWQAVPPQ